ncbi:MAG: hypothetical protein ACR2PG_23180, partial [Hyphomicrobiaceae bacterium]
MKLISNLLLLIMAPATVAILVIGKNFALGQPANVRPFWSDILAFVAQDEARGFTYCRTLFVGSSSIRLWRSLVVDFPKRNVIRRGFGGAQLTHVLQYFDLLIAPHRPSEIVLYAGENDLASGRSPAEVLTALKSLMKIKSQSLGATPVFFIAIKPSLYHWDKFNAQVQANARVKELAQLRKDLVFVDVVPLMLENGKPRK